MLKAIYYSHTLFFNRPSGTSRGVLTQKKIWIIEVFDNNNPSVKGIGECNPLVGLSIDDVPEYEDKIKEVCSAVDELKNKDLFSNLKNFPSIYFGMEMALLDLKNGGKRLYFPNSPFVKNNYPIKINGLIWMGKAEFMLQQIEEKLNKGFSCLKLKIGAIDFEQELEILSSIRQRYSGDELEIRVDANGAFTKQDALTKLKALSEFELHSIEQPIATKQIEAMAQLCRSTPLDIALDEELIGVFDISEKRKLLEKILPQYIILKPSLIGGFKGTLEWISVAGELGIPWWITSALESNIGLNAISQFTSTFHNPLPQGLGTGQLYTNNFESSLYLDGEWLYHNTLV